MIGALNERQRKKFINQEVFQTPEWLIDKDILARIESDGMVDRIRSF